MDRSALHQEFPSFEFLVERGKIREFANSIEDDNPMYRNVEYAQASPFGNIITPPTFLRTFFYEDPISVQALKVRDWSYILHGEQEFEYFLPLLAGDALTCQDRIAGMFEKEGRRGGKLTFGVIETTFHNQRGEKVQVARRTLIETSQTVAAEPKPQRTDSKESSAAQTAAPPRRIVRPVALSFDDVNIGDSPTPLVMGPLTRTQCVKYAGASGDFNPIHHDEMYAQNAGLPSLFAMGMLCGGYCARLLTDWFGDGALRRFRLRFRSRFWPGDMVTITSRITGKNEDGEEARVDCEYSAVNQHGEALIIGDVAAALPRREG